MHLPAMMLSLRRTRVPYIIYRHWADVVPALLIFKADAHIIGVNMFLQDPIVQWCDATGAAVYSNVRLQKILFQLFSFYRFMKLPYIQK